MEYVLICWKLILAKKNEGKNICYSIIPYAFIFIIGLFEGDYHEKCCFIFHVLHINRLNDQFSMYMY